MRKRCFGFGNCLGRSPRAHMRYRIRFSEGRPLSFVGFSRIRQESKHVFLDLVIALDEFHEHWCGIECVFWRTPCKLNRISLEFVRNKYKVFSDLEISLIQQIAPDCPSARDLCGKTSLSDVAVLARDAVGAIGNDTGPIHLIAAAGCPTVVLFSSASDPALTAPQGSSVDILRRKNLEELSVEAVAAALRLR